VLTFFTALFAGVAALLGALSVPLVRGRVPPNATYGLRVRATLADEAVWYAANAQAGRDGLAVAGALFVLAVAIPAVWPSISVSVYVGVWIAALVVGEVAVAVRGWRSATRLLTVRRGEVR
jgi:hypothetical protein